METILKKNDIIICTIESYTSEGYGVARYNGRAIFIPYTIIREVHKIIIVKITNTVIYGKSIEIIESSPNRLNSICKYFGKCGGCHLQFMTYEEELSFKRQKVIDALNHLGKQDILNIEIVPSDKIDRYRNKAVFNVSDNKFGYFKPRTHELVEVDDCFLVNEMSINIAKQVSLKGLNHISIRDKVCTLYGKEYKGKIPNGISGLVLCNNRRDNSLLDGEYKTLWGNPIQIESICNKKFYISPQSFYQVNSLTVEKLYNIACDFAGTGDTAVELYCGVGTISICLAERFKKIHSFEVVQEAIVNANNNKKLNNINNIEFTCADASNFCKYIDCKPDVVLVDPPRKGLSNDVIKSIIDLLPNKIVYISCNPSTLARDIKILSKSYSINKIVAVDMFPRTFHVETVVLMSRNQE